MNQSLFDDCPLTVLRCRLTPTKPAALPRFKGATFRGALGIALKELGCSNTSGQLCDHCIHPTTCAYGALFDGQEGLAFESVLPFAIDPPIDDRVDYSMNDTIELGLTLFGSSRVWLPWVVWGIGRMAWKGLGRGRTPWTLTEAEVEGPAGRWTSLLSPFNDCPQITVADVLANKRCPSLCRMEFVTPTQILENGEPTSQPSAATIVRRLLRRCTLIARRYSAGDVDQTDCSKLIEPASQIEVIETSLRNCSWDRYSTRQQRRHPMAGFKGHMILSGIPAELWPLFVFGERVHIGKSASFGMGKYLLSDAKGI